MLPHLVEYRSSHIWYYPGYSKCCHIWWSTEVATFGNILGYSKCCHIWWSTEVATFGNIRGYSKCCHIWWSTEVATFGNILGYSKCCHIWWSTEVATFGIILGYTPNVATFGAVRSSQNWQKAGLLEVTKIGK